jgi:3',5'-nucleoside bisphosphate phosphatase
MKNGDRMHRTQSQSTVSLLCGIASFAFLMLCPRYGHSQVRTILNIPDIPGYLTLKCDFHSHTVFSDGLVWPTLRVEEAWREGLDALALTDHVEYQPHGEEIPFQPNRPFGLASEDARRMGILLIRGAEITRDMPPGHLNAIFLQDVSPLAVPDYRKAVQTAVSQGAFVFWNHPDFPGPEGQFVWNSEIEKLRADGFLRGIEVVNGDKYYPEAHRWCMEKKLTMIGDSDIHNPISMEYDLHGGQHRPMTLVFAEEKTLPSIKTALLARRTALYWKNLLIGEEQYLKPIFQAAVEVLGTSSEIEGSGEGYVQIRNRSDLPFELEPLSQIPEKFKYSGLSLPPRKVGILRVSIQAGGVSGVRNVTLPFKVKNLLVAPNQSLQIELKVGLDVKVGIAQ